MKTFKEFLLEETKEETAEIIKKDCAEFLTKYPSVTLARGLREASIHRAQIINEELGILKLQARKDRQPSSSAQWMHETLGSFFKETFGTNFRTQGVFTYSTADGTGLYGKTYVIIPVGDFEYVCSPVVADAISFESQLLDFLWMASESENDQNEAMKDIVATYLDMLDKDNPIHAKTIQKLKQLKHVGEVSLFRRSEEYDAIMSLDRQKVLQNFLNRAGKKMYWHNHGLDKVPPKTEIIVDCSSYYAIPHAVYKHGFNKLINKE